MHKVLILRTNTINSLCRHETNCGIYTQWNIYYSKVKLNTLLMHATTWIIPELIMLRERSQTEKEYTSMILLV